MIREAEKAGIARDWIDAAQRSPIYALINTYKVALPLHPEYRTMPMVWYIPPLSPVVDVVAETGEDAEDKGNLFAAIDALRIPVEYLAELFTAGDVAPVDAVLKKLAAMRCYMRDINMGRDPDGSIPAAVGMTEEEMYDMYRLLAIAKYDERYVIPPAHAEQAHSLEELATECSVSEYGGGQQDLFGEGSGAPTPIAVENFQMLQDRQTSDSLAGPENKGARVNLLNWDGKGSPAGTLPAEGDGLVSGASAEADAAARTAHHRVAVGLAAPRLPRRGAARPRRAAPVGLAGAARPRSGTRSAAFLDHLESHAAAGAPGRLRRDLRHPRRCNLFLTYFAHGDTRKRGMALLRFKQTYLAAGFELDDAELPDHLCVVLEFAATVDQRPGPRPDARPPRRPRAAAALAARPGLALGRAWSTRSPPPCRRCAATSATPYAGSPPRARPRRRSGSRRSPHPQFSPGAATGAAPEPPCCRCRRSREPAHERVPLRRRPLPLPDDLRRRAPVALPLRQVRLDHAVLPALREPAAAHRQPAVPLRDARRRRRPRHRPADPAVVDRRGRASASTPTTWSPSPAACSPASMTVVGMAILIYRRRTVGPVFSATTRHGQGDVRLPRRS